jgi:hypothetical protein
MEQVSRPVPGLLRLSREGASGALWFRLSDRKIGITLQNGGVVQVVGLPEMMLLEGVKLSVSVNTGDMLKDIGAAVGGGVPAHEAMDAASWGIGRFLGRIAVNPDCTAAWDDGAKPPAGAFPLPMPLLRAFAKGLQESRPPDMAQRHWRNKTVLIVRVADAVRENERATEGLSPVAARALNLAGDGEVLSGLVEHMIGGLPARRIKTWWALDLLLQSGLLIFDSHTAGQFLLDPESVDSDLEDDTNEDPIKPDPAVIRMHRRFLRLRKMPPLAALDIKVVDPDEGIEIDLVREAFRRSAKKYHPDLFIGQSTSLRRAAAQCFQVLGTYKSEMEEKPLLQAELDRIKAERAGRAHVVASDRMKAKVHYNKGMNFFRNRAYSAARDAFAEAVILDPDYRMAAARRTHCRAVLKEIPYQAAFLTLSEIEADNVGEKIELLYLTAWLLKLLGKTSEANRQYRAILERNPAHREALREVRLWENRSGAREAASRVEKGESTPSGFFQAIRKRRGN